MRAVLAFALLAVSMPAFAQERAPAPKFSKDECTVWARELAFADSVTAHDAKAFADFVNTGAVFSANSPTPLRGREAIVKDWAGIIDGSAFKLSWYPRIVHIGGEPDIAYSTGPALIESNDPKAKDRYTLLTFASTWHRDSDDQWRVAFDAGAPPRPASEADVAAFKAGRKTCPQG